MKESIEMNCTELYAPVVFRNISVSRIQMSFESLKKFEL